MALVPCRECGKEVSEEAKICPNCGIKTPSKKRYQQKLYIRVTIALLLLGSVAWGYHSTITPATPVGAGISAPTKIQKDVPIKDQVIQKNDKEIIKEMIDSGESVRSISKKTGIRKDEVRKIKKEKEAAEKGK